MRWVGSSWSLQTVPLPAGATASELEGVDCPSASYCTAGGTYTERSGRSWALAVRYSAPNWALQTVPNPSGATRSIFIDASCTEASKCTAVGAYTESRGVQVTLAERWNGTEWVIQTTPNPVGSENTVFQNVSCAGASSCVAVGDWLNSRRWSTLAQSWNGTEWSIETTPN
jgi:hypothetical protein